MKKSAQKVTKAAKGAARKTYNNVETHIMAAVGRKTVSDKVSIAKRVGKKALRAALIAGATAAAGVVVKEIRKRKSKPA